MALIECPECSKEISSKAPNCPQCGAPKLEIPLVMEGGTGGPIVTIQETGKSLKIQQAVAITLMISGMAGCVMDPQGMGFDGAASIGFYASITGGCWLIWVRLAIWFEHG